MTLTDLPALLGRETVTKITTDDIRMLWSRKEKRCDRHAIYYHMENGTIPPYDHPTAAYCWKPETVVKAINSYLCKHGWLRLYKSV